MSFQDTVALVSVISENVIFTGVVHDCVIPPKIMFATNFDESLNPVGC